MGILAKKMQTLLQPLASGESAFFWLLQARTPRLERPSAVVLLQSDLSPVIPADEKLRLHILGLQFYTLHIC